MIHDHPPAVLCNVFCTNVFLSLRISEYLTTGPPRHISYVDTQIEIVIQVDEHVEIDHQAYQDHDYARPDFNFSQMRLQPLQYLTKAIQTQSQEQKWDAQAKRIRQKQ